MKYGEGLKKEMLDLVNQFFREEAGNRITNFNMGGLIGGMNQLFDKHEVKQETNS